MTQHIREALRSPGSGDTRGHRTQCTELKARLGNPEARGSSPHPPSLGCSLPTTRHRNTWHTCSPAGLSFRQCWRRRRFADETENHPLLGARDPPPLGDEGSAREASRLAPTQGPAGASAEQAPQGGISAFTSLRGPQENWYRPLLSHLARAPRTSTRSIWRGGEAHLRRGKARRGGGRRGGAPHLGTLARGGAHLGREIGAPHLRGADGPFRSFA